ncbi:hypothetical protein, partial [Cognatishimia sp.]
MDAVLPAGILPMSQATLQDMSHVTSTTGDVTFGKSEIHMGPNSRVTIAGSFSGNLWVHSITKDVSGTMRARFLSPTYQPEGIRQPD